MNVPPLTDKPMSKQDLFKESWWIIYPRDKKKSWRLATNVFSKMKKLKNKNFSNER